MSDLGMRNVWPGCVARFIWSSGNAGRQVFVVRDMTADTHRHYPEAGGGVWWEVEALDALWVWNVAGGDKRVVFPGHRCRTSDNELRPAPPPDGGGKTISVRNIRKAAR